MLKINEELQNLIPASTNEEYEQLKENIKNEGLREPIITWNNTIIDGHHRYRICNELNIEYKTIEKQFNDLDEVRTWMITNQFGRRNINSYQRAVLALELEKTLSKVAKEKERIRKSKSEDLFETVNDFCNVTKVNSIEDAASKANIGSRTLSKVKKIEETASPELKKKLSEGTTTINAVYQQIVNEEKRSAILEVRKETISFGKDIVQNKDAVSFINSLEDNSIDLFLIDPPYAINYKDTRDTGLANYKDDTEYALELLEEVMKSIKPKLKEDAHLYIFSGYTHMFRFQQIISKFFFVQDNPIIWVKNNHTMADFKTKWASKYEVIWFAKNNETSTRYLNYGVSPDVVEFAIPRNKVHSAQKPTELLEYLIKNSTIEGEVVCDTFMGSGSTYVATKNCNRQFVGCEMDESIFNILIKNIENK